MDAVLETASNKELSRKKKRKKNSMDKHDLVGALGRNSVAIAIFFGAARTIHRSL